MPSYIDLERSKFGGRPAEFYHFYRGVTDWRITPVPMAVVLADGQVFSPVKGIERSDIENGGEDSPGQLNIQLPTEIPVVQAVLNGRSDATVNIKIYQYHKSIASDTKIIFWGEVESYDRDRNITTLICDPTLAQGDMIVPRGLYQSEECTYNTFDPFTCKVNPASFTHTDLVTDIDGLEVTVDGAAAFGGADLNYFTLGVFSKGPQSVAIERQNGDVMTLQHIPAGLTVGDSVSLLAGDDRRPTTCLNKFNNILRNMSFSKTPVTNPFYGQGLKNY